MKLSNKAGVRGRGVGQETIIAKAGIMQDWKTELTNQARRFTGL